MMIRAMRSALGPTLQAYVRKGEEEYHSSVHLASSLGPNLTVSTVLCSNASGSGKIVVSLLVRGIAEVPNKSSLIEE